MGDPSEAQKKLEQLQGKTIRAKLEPYWDEIEGKIEAGITHAEIVEALVTAGIDVSLGTFRKNLTRHRSRMAAKGSKAATPKATPKSTVPIADGNPPAQVDDEAEEADFLSDSERRLDHAKSYMTKRPRVGRKQ